MRFFRRHHLHRPLFACIASSSTAVAASSSTPSCSGSSNSGSNGGGLCSKSTYVSYYETGTNGDPQHVIHYDSYRRTPKWVITYHPKPTAADGDAAAAASSSSRAKASFYADAKVDMDVFRIKPTDYNNSGFDRGHMIPAADFAVTQEALQSTFTMTNIAPQSPQLNKGFWAKLEALVRYLHVKHEAFEEMVVITGPVYAPVKFGATWTYMHRSIGTFPKLIHVPTHFFKVVVGRRASARQSTSPLQISGSGTSALTLFQAGNGKGVDGVTFIGAFLVPNTDDVDPKTPLERFAVRIDVLEALVGCSFFGDGLGAKDRARVDGNVPPGSFDVETLLTPALFAKANADAGLGGNGPAKGSKRRVTGAYLFEHLCDAPGVHCDQSIFAKSS